MRNKSEAELKREREKSAAASSSEKTLGRLMDMMTPVLAEMYATDGWGNVIDAWRAANAARREDEE
jgi:hypothetical protein